MRTTISTILALALAACAPRMASGTNVQVLVRDFVSGQITNRPVTVTLTAPGQSVAGPWVFAGDAVTHYTDTTGQTTFSNMVSLGQYRLDIAGNPSRSFPFSLSVTSGTFNVVQLIGTNNSVPVFYDSAQVDALISQAHLGDTNFLSSTVTNTVQGILANSNHYLGTFVGDLVGRASFATNSQYADTATNGALSGFHTTGQTNAGNIQTTTENVTGTLTAASLVGPLTGNASSATTAGTATNGAASGFFTTSQTNSGNIQTASENVTGNLTAGSLTGPLSGNVVGNLTGNVTGNLVGSATSATNALLSAYVTNGIFSGVKGTNGDWYAVGGDAFGWARTMWYPNGTRLEAKGTNGFMFGDGGLGFPVLQYSANLDDINVSTKGQFVRVWANTNGTALLDQKSGRKVLVSTNGVLLSFDSTISGGAWPATAGMFGTANYLVFTNATGTLLFVNAGLTNSGPIQATAFYGPLHGNADTATAAVTAQFAGTATNALNAPTATNAIWASVATNLVMSPKLTNATVYQNFTTIYDNGFIAITDGAFGIELLTRSGNPVLEWDNPGDNLTIGHDAGLVMKSDTNGTAIYDEFGGKHVSIRTNRLEVNTNAYAWSLTVTNGLTNQTLTANTLKLANADKGESSLANGGANTFLQGTTPPTYTGITEASLPSSVPLKTVANVFTSTNNFANLGVVGTLTAQNIFGFTDIWDDGIGNGQVVYATLDGTTHNRLEGVAGTGTTLLHGTIPPTFTSVVEADMGLTDLTTANSSAAKHGFMPKLDGNANHFFNGNGGQTTIPDAALSANVALLNANNALTGNNTLSGNNSFSGVNGFSAQANFGSHVGIDSLTVTNGFTNSTLTANALVYGDNGVSGPRLTSVPAGGASQYLKSGSPPAFATIQGSEISGTVAAASVATVANGLASGAPGTNNILYGNQDRTNALVVHKWTTISNNLGRVDFYAGNQTNTGSLTLGNSGGLYSQNGVLAIGGTPTLPSGTVSGTATPAIAAGQGTFTSSTADQYDLGVMPTVSQGGTAGFSALMINPTVSSSGSGASDGIQVRNGGTLKVNVALSGAQTNAGPIQATAFYGPLHGNADTASTVTSSSFSTVATNLVAGATVTNLTVKETASGEFTTVFEDGTSHMVVDAILGQFYVNRKSAPVGPWLFFSGGAAGSETMEIGRGGNNWAVIQTSSSTTLYDSAAHLRATLDNSGVALESDTTVNGTLGYKLKVLSKTANYTVTTGDSGACINNNGAVGAVTNTLPASAAGLHYALAVVANQNLAFKGNGTDTIRSVGTVSGAGGLVFSSTVGSTLHLYCPASGGWWIDSTNGSWTLQ